MAKQKKRWGYSPPKKTKPKIPEALKGELTEKANALVESTLKPWKLDFDTSAKEHGFNYVVDIYTKWHKNCLLFRAKYACPGPNALSPFFEDSFTRLAYMANGRFNLAYMCHTGKWCEVFTDLTMEEAFAAIRNQAFFHPPG